jgi:hypothetical protein
LKEVLEILEGAGVHAEALRVQEEDGFRFVEVRFRGSEEERADVVDRLTRRGFGTGRE